jgi:ABC-type transporter Mla subunit MlaD
MNTEARRFRHVGAKSGAFVLAAAVLAIGVLLLAARAQWWFASSRSYTVRLPDEGSGGLRSGSAVELLGTVAGYVKDVSIDDGGTLSAKVAVREDFARFVTAESVCMIRKKTLDLGGDTYMQITRGTGPSLLSGATLTCRSDHNVLDSFADLVAQLGPELQPALAEARDAAHEYAALARTLRDPDGPVLRLVARLDELAQKTGEGKGTAARLLNDASWANEVDASLRGMRTAIERANATVDKLGNGDNGVPAALADLRALLAELRPIVADLGKAVAALPEITATARNEVRGLPGLVQRSQLMLGELEKVVQAAQRHWLLRGYVEPAPATRRVGGEGLGDGK